MADRNMLAEHGTELMVLKPRNVLQAAEADIKRRRRNIAPGAVGYEHYAFHRIHVRRSVDTEDLLVRALMNPMPGLHSAKYNTRLLYANATLLLAAIHLAREKVD